MNKHCMWVALFALAALAGPAAAQTGDSGDRSLAQADEIAELKRQLGVVVNELQEIKRQSSVAETPEQLESEYGFGPAASKVYGGARSSVSLGGYLEANYTNQIGDVEGNGEDTTNVLRSVVYLGYKFTDKIIFNSEIEIENANTAQNGVVEVEIAQLDFLINPMFNVRAGLLLAPLGFINEVHEPPFFLGNIRPEPETRIIPSTFRENGVGFFGTIGESFTYRTYILNGFDGGGFDSRGLGGGKQNASRASANDLAFVGRFDYEPLEGLQLGGSLFMGDSGQDREDLPEARTQLWEAHAQYRNSGFQFRALYTQAKVGDARELSQRRQDLALPLSTVAERLIGGYAELGYDVMRLLRPGSEATLTPFFRFEYSDPQNKVPTGFDKFGQERRRIYVPGIAYKPVPNVVVKLDYRNIDSFEGNTADELILGIGLAF